MFRYGFGSAMAASIVLGALAVRRRDFAAHGAWMTRGYAIGIAAGTLAAHGSTDADGTAAVTGDGGSRPVGV